MSISCADRCTYQAAYDGTFLWVYGKGFTSLEVMEFRLDGNYLGHSDHADANGNVVSQFDRFMTNGTYQICRHEAWTAKNSDVLTFVVNVFDPQTATTCSSSSSSSTSPSMIVEPPRLVVGDYRLAGVVFAAIAAMIVISVLVRRRTTSSRMK